MLPRKRHPRPSVSEWKRSSSRLISWWSGATPPRSRPHGVGSRSSRSISTSRCEQGAPSGGGALDRAAPGEELSVQVERVIVALGDLELGEDGVDRARLDAGVAVDAQLGIDVELFGRLEVGIARLRVDAVDRTDLDARVVLDAAAGDYVGHGRR